MSPRIVKQPEERRSEIIDASQRLMITKGFDQMTIQDIIEELHISKGAFYHYFASKQALLDAMIERYGEQAMQIIRPIVDDPGLPALEKFERLFTAANRWKLTQKPLMMALLRGWYMNENTIVRQKQTAATLQVIGPMISSIICQGVQEGVFDTPYPEQVGEVAIVLMTGLGDSVAALLLDPEPREDTGDRLVATAAVFTASIERVLGASPGSLHLFDPDLLQEWVIPPVDT